MQRYRGNQYGAIPSTMEQLELIPEPFTTTESGEPFLFYFTEYEEQHSVNKYKVIIMATRADLIALFDATRVFIDGTFKVSIITLLLRLVLMNADMYYYS